MAPRKRTLKTQAERSAFIRSRERERDERDVRILRLLDDGVPVLRVCSQYRGLTKGYIEKLKEESNPDDK